MAVCSVVLHDGAALCGNGGAWAPTSNAEAIWHQGAPLPQSSHAVTLLPVLHLGLLVAVAVPCLLLLPVHGLPIHASTVGHQSTRARLLLLLLLHDIESHFKARLYIWIAKQEHEAFFPARVSCKGAAS